MVACVGDDESGRELLSKCCYGDVRSVIRAQDGGCVVVPIVLSLLICQNLQAASCGFDYCAVVLRRHWWRGYTFFDCLT